MTTEHGPIVAAMVSAAVALAPPLTDQQLADISTLLGPVVRRPQPTTARPDRRTRSPKAA